MASTFEFQDIGIIEKIKSHSIFGTVAKTEGTQIGVSQASAKATIVTFENIETTPTDGTVKPDATMSAKFHFGDEPFESFKVYVTIAGAPDGTAFSLNSSEPGTTPPIEINKSTISSDPVNRFITVSGMPDGYETVLSLHFWSNGKRLKDYVKISVDIDRITQDDGSPLRDRAEKGERQSGPDVYGIDLGIPTPVSHPVGTSELTLVANS